MKLSDFKDILLKADPQLTKYLGTGKGDYTVWTPGSIDRSMSDNCDEDKIQRVYVDRYTKIDDDPVVQAIWDELEKTFIPFEYDIDYEVDTKYIHHIFTCYVPIN